MRTRRIWRLSLIAVLLVVLLLAAAFFAWALTPQGPGEEALAAMENGDNVVVAERPEGIVFYPDDYEPHVGLILYPGARVEPRSYAPLARLVAEQGYLVVVVPMPLNLAILDPDRADGVIPSYPDVRVWAIGGHSLGGAMAARYADRSSTRIVGLALLAAYPPSSTTLNDSNMEATSVFGTFDGVLNFGDLEQARSRMPTRTAVVPIAGGNHAQFGDYGRQWGDSDPGITAKDQWGEAAQAILRMLLPIRIKAQ